MPDIGADTATAVAYPPTSLYEQWCAQAEELDLPVSQYIIRMVEAGRKPIDADNIMGDSREELRQQRAELRQELRRARDRIESLERQLYQSEQTEIVDYVTDNPGATMPEIIQHVVDTVPGRVAGHLEMLENDTLDRREDGFYPDTTNDDDTPTETPHQ